MLLFKMTDTHYKRRRTLSSSFRKKPKTSPSTEAKRPEVSGLLTIELLLISIYSKELQSIEVLLWLIITFCLRRSRSSIAAAFSTGLQIGTLSKPKLMLPPPTPKGSWLGTVPKQTAWDLALWTPHFWDFGFSQHTSCLQHSVTSSLPESSDLSFRSIDFIR